MVRRILNKYELKNLTRMEGSTVGILPWGCVQAFLYFSDQTKKSMLIESRRRPQVLKWAMGRGSFWFHSLASWRSGGLVHHKTRNDHPHHSDTMSLKWKPRRSVTIEATRRRDKENKDHWSWNQSNQLLHTTAKCQREKWRQEWESHVNFQWVPFLSTES